MVRILEGASSLPYFLAPWLDISGTLENKTDILFPNDPEISSTVDS